MDDLDFFLNSMNNQETLDHLPTVILAKIASFMPIKEALFSKLPLLSKSLKNTISQSNFCKAYNAELHESGKNVDNYVLDQKLINTIEIGEDLFKIIKLLKVNFDRNGNKDLELVPIDSSSKDYNQSVHRTINRNDSD
jgi:hypothetical protein